MNNADFQLWPKRIFTMYIIVWYTLGWYSSAQKPNTDYPEGPFLGMTATDTSRLIASELLTSSLTEYNGTFNPEGTEFYYTSEVAGKSMITFTSMNENELWSPSRIASFSGQYDEYDPIFAPDGQRLYFSSQRPTSDNPNNNNSNIWFVERNGSKWSEPSYIPLTDQADYFSSITSEGNIYFNVWDHGDIYKAIQSDTGFVITRLPDIINNRGAVGDPFVAPDESYLIFRGYRSDHTGRGELYISFQIDEKWTEPESLGTDVNSEGHEMCPYVTTDGKYFIYASSRVKEDYDFSPLAELNDLQEKSKSTDNGQLNIYYRSADFIQKLRKKH